MIAGLKIMEIKWNTTQLGNVMFDNGWFKPGVICGAKAVARAEIKVYQHTLKNIRPEYIAITIGGGVGKRWDPWCHRFIKRFNSGAVKVQNLNKVSRKGILFMKKIIWKQQSMCELGYG